MTKAYRPAWLTDKDALSDVIQEFSSRLTDALMGLGKGNCHRSPTTPFSDRQRGRWVGSDAGNSIHSSGDPMFDAVVKAIEEDQDA